MQTGPSKEELENYFKNSRQYFDELAKEYYETDREYYDKYIAPFYNPLTGAARSSKLPVMIIIISAAFAIIFGAGVAMFFLLTQEEPAPNQTQQSKQNPSVQTPGKKNEVMPDTAFNTIIDTTIAGLKDISFYHKGLVYYSMKDYSKAEEYLKKVPPDDMNYKDAQKKLTEIKSLSPSERRYIKPRALERTQ